MPTRVAACWLASVGLVSLGMLWRALSHPLSPTRSHPPAPTHPLPRLPLFPCSLQANKGGSEDLSLSSLLIIPVKRICLYPLLLDVR